MPAKSKKQATPESESSSSRSTSPEHSKETTSSKGAEEESSSESEEGSGSSSGSESDNDAEDKEESTKTSRVSFRPPEAFKPPTGFKAAKQQSTSSGNSALSSLRGKQVLHITAPAFLPLSKVKEVSLAKVMQGEPVLQHEGVNYGIPTENLSQGDQGGKALLLYDPKTQTYHSAPASNIQSYHVQELINLPKTLRNEQQASTAKEHYTKPPRRQPKHLKMRFRPVGSGQAPAETLGSSESEGEDTVKVSKESSKDKERKRKHRQTDGDEQQPAALPRKKSKKHSESQEDAGSRMDVDEPVKEKSKKSSKSKEEKKRKKEKA